MSAMLVAVIVAPRRWVRGSGCGCGVKGGMWDGSGMNEIGDRFGRRKYGYAISLSGMLQVGGGVVGYMYIGR